MTHYIDRNTSIERGQHIDGHALVINAPEWFEPLTLVVLDRQAARRLAERAAQIAVDFEGESRG